MNHLSAQGNTHSTSYDDDDDVSEISDLSSSLGIESWRPSAGMLK